jgi:phage terminase small subunit
MKGRCRTLLNEKEKSFANEYIINKGNAYKAALAAGYAVNTARCATEWLCETRKYSDKKRHLPYKPELKDYIDELLEKIESEKIADAKEVMEYLTSVLRGSSESEVVVIEGVGDGCSIARRMTKKPDEKEKLKAADSLSKILGLSKEKIDVNANQVILVDDVPEDW